MSGRDHIYLFQQHGFTIGATIFTHCHIWYHAKCIISGRTFKSRNRQRKDLQYHPIVVVFLFVCELYMVRAHVGRELREFYKHEILLLRLEMIRMTNMYNQWSRNTLFNYRLALCTLNLFQLEFDLQVLNRTFPLKSFQ